MKYEGGKWEGGGWGGGGGLPKKKAQPNSFFHYTDVELNKLDVKFRAEELYFTHQSSLLKIGIPIKNLVYQVRMQVYFSRVGEILKKMDKNVCQLFSEEISEE